MKNFRRSYLFCIQITVKLRNSPLLRKWYVYLTYVVRVQSWEWGMISSPRISAAPPAWWPRSSLTSGQAVLPIPADDVQSTPRELVFTSYRLRELGSSSDKSGIDAPVLEPRAFIFTPVYQRHRFGIYTSCCGKKPLVSGAAAVTPRFPVQSFQTRLLE